MQLHENRTALSLVVATLTRCVKAKSFVCHSYKKHWGWGRGVAQKVEKTEFFPARPGGCLPVNTSTMPTTESSRTPKGRRVPNCLLCPLCELCGLCVRIHTQPLHPSGREAKGTPHWKLHFRLSTVDCRPAYSPPPTFLLPAAATVVGFTTGTWRKESEPSRSPRPSSFSLRLGRPPQHSRRPQHSSRRARPNQDRLVLPGKNFDGQLQSPRMPLSLAP
jgi:hypothetical protein